MPVIIDGLYKIVKKDIFQKKCLIFVFVQYNIAIALGC